MKKIKVRCYKGFAAAEGKFNIEVYYTVPDMGYFRKLFTCINCGEIFVIDKENPKFAGKTAREIAADAICPKCNKRLPETIRPYPENFRTESGQEGHFEPERIIPPDSESLVKEFWEVGV
jgi:rubredoxin